MKQRDRFALALQDSIDELSLRLVINGKPALKAQLRKPPAVRVRTPLPDPVRLEDNMRFFASKALGGHDYRGQLEYYIQCRDRGIQAQVLEVRKALRQIASELRAIGIAKTLLARSHQAPPNPP